MDRLSELLLRCRAGRNAAEWNELLEAVLPDLIIALRGCCGGKNAQVDDFAQDAMLKIVDKISSCRAKNFPEFRSWCTTIAVRIAADYYRKAGSKVVVMDPTEIQRYREASIEGGGALSADATAAKEAIESLESPGRELLTLYCIEGLSYSDIAIKLRKNYDAVRVAVPRYMAELLKRFK